MQQQIRQLKNLEQLEVKTISERSQEDSVEQPLSLSSSKVTTPMHQADTQGKKQIQILELLNEICEEAGEETKMHEDEEEEAETEKEENRIIEDIMKVLQPPKDGSD